MSLVTKSRKIHVLLVVFAVVLAAHWLPAIYISLVYDVPIGVGAACASRPMLTLESCIRDFLTTGTDQSGEE
jgi:hypothetical protein